MDSQAKYAVLAAGEGDVLLRLISPSRPDYREKIWDQAAGSIVVTEAGGRITDLDGRSLDFSHGRTLAKNRGILATNGRLHDAILDGLRQIGRHRPGSCDEAMRPCVQLSAPAADDCGHSPVDQPHIIPLSYRATQPRTARGIGCDVSHSGRIVCLTPGARATGTA